MRPLLLVAGLLACSTPARTDEMHTLFLEDFLVCPSNGTFTRAIVIAVIDETKYVQIISFDLAAPRGSYPLLVNKTKHRAEIKFGICREQPASRAICPDSSTDWYASLKIDVDPAMARQSVHFPVPSIPVQCTTGVATLEALPKG